MHHRLLSWQLALLIVLMVHAVSVYCLRDLRFNNAPDVYYTRHSPAVQVRDALRRSFPTDEVLTVVFQGNDLYSASFLRQLEDFVKRLEAHPLVDRVSAITSIERVSATDDGFSVGPLIDVGSLDEVSSEALRQRVLGDRFAPGVLASRDGTLLAVVVRPKTLTSSFERLSVAIAVETSMLRSQVRPHLAGQAGPITLDVAQLQSIIDDSAVFVPLTVGLSLLLMWWVVGRWRPVVISAVAMSTVVLPTLALVAVAGQPYTMVTAILPSLLAAYSSATLLHFFSAVMRGHAMRLSRGRSIDHALEEGLKPGLFNVVTTAAGLLSLILVPMPPIQVFGVAGAFGTLLVFGVVYYLVPPFLRHWDNQRWPVKQSGMGRFGRLAPKLAIFSMRHARWVIVITVGLTIACLPLALKVQAESDLLAFFKPNHPVSAATRLIESKLSGVGTLEILIEGTGPDSLMKVTQLQAIQEFQHWLDKLPEVDRSISFVDMVEEMHFAMNGEQPGFRSIPPNDRLLKQYMLVYDGRDMYDLIDRDLGRARILLSLHAHGARALGDVVRTIQRQIETQAQPGLTLQVGGYGRLFADQSNLLISGQGSSFAGAFVQIFVFMLILWRSFSAASLCLIPNLAPLYFVFVLMGALSIYLDTSTVMIAGIVLGITVDDTIHLYHGYSMRRRAGMSATWAIARCFKASGAAVMAISVLLIGQFGLLAMSDFIPTSNFGLMTAVGLLSGQVFELLLTPALLLLKEQLSQWRRQKERSPAAP